MKLYFSPGACSLSPHIVLCEASIDHELEQVDLRSKKTASGEDFQEINPKGYVPALKLDNGEVLTEGPAIVQYLGDLKPTSKLVPAADTMERYRLQEWLNFISTEVHKQFSPLFNPGTPPESKQAALIALASRFDYLSRKLEGRAYLMGEIFSAADAYLYTVLRWCKPTGMDLDKWPVLKAFVERVGARPAVQTALRAQGLG
jgi:glutathione S-transferase